MSTVSTSATAVRRACRRTGVRGGECAAVRNAAAGTRIASTTTSHHTRPSCSARVLRFSRAVSGPRSTSSRTCGIGRANGPSTRPFQVAPSPMVNTGQTTLGIPSSTTANVSAGCPRVAATTSATTTPRATQPSSSTSIACAAGRTDRCRRSSRAGNGAERETSSAATSTPASHAEPDTSVSGTSAVKPASGLTPNSSPRSFSVSSPRGSAKVRCAASAAPSRPSSQTTAIRAAQPASSATLATARRRSGRRKPAPTTSAPTRVTDRGITVRFARVPASPPASPETSTVPPTAVTTVAATTRGNAPSGRSEAPAAHRPSAATTPMTISPATAVTIARPHPWRETAWSWGLCGITLPR